MPKSKGQSSLQRVFLGKHERALRLADFDIPILLISISLVFFGIVMVTSVSLPLTSGSFSMTMSHIQKIFIALALALFVFRFPIVFWQRYSIYFLLFSLLLLIFVFIPLIGREVNGAYRWIRILGFSFQPSELMKLFIILYTADFAARKSTYLGDFKKGFLPMLITLGLTGSFLLLEPDLGACIVISTVAIGILFLGGLSYKFLTSLVFTSGCVFSLLIIFEPWRFQRVISFMNPLDFLFGSGYQLSHSLFAFARGDWFGVGLGRSMEKLFYLPEAHNDFILAVIGEELGLAGVWITIGLFISLIVKGFMIGTKAAVLERGFASLVAYGISLWIALQSLISMAVNLGLSPTKGLTLPFVSFGGSALLVNFISLGILLRIDWENRLMMRGAVS